MNWFKRFNAKYPFVLPLPSFLAGIIFAEYVFISTGNLFLLTTLALLASLSCYIIIRSKWLFHIIIPFFMAIILTIIPQRLSVSPNIKSFVNADKNLTVDLLGTIISPPEKLATRLRFTLKAQRIIFPISTAKERDREIKTFSPQEPANQGQAVFGKVLVSVYDDIHFPEFLYGDLVLLKTVKLKPPRSYQNQGNFDYIKYLRRQGINVVTAFSGMDKISLVNRPLDFDFKKTILALRKRLIANIEANFQTDESHLIKAIILGERLGPDSELRKNFNNSGLAHLLAVSGLHVGFVAVLFYFLFNKFLLFLRFTTILRPLVQWRFIPSKIASLFCILPVVLYTYLTGANIPTIRAAIMACTYLIARFLGRDKNHYHILSLAAWAILLWNPYAIFHIGFQLSFLAVAILIWANGFRSNLVKGDGFKQKKVSFFQRFQRWSVIREQGISYIWFAIAASYGTMPLVAYHFSRVNPWSPLANMITVPVGSLLVMWGVISLITSLVIPRISYVLFFPLALLAKTTHTLASLFASIPLASISIPTPPLLSIVALFPLIGSLLYCRKSRRWLPVGLIFTILFLSPLILKYISTKMSNNLSVTFLDVGQGDASYIRFPNGQDMMIDSGGSREGRVDIGQAVLLPFLKYNWVSRLNLIANSHPHPDHTRGFFTLIDQMHVDRMWLSPIALENPLGLDIHSLASTKKVTKEIVTSGKRYVIANVLLEVLHPPADYAAVGRERENQENNSSLVIKLSYGRVSFLFTGDIEKEGENALLPLGEKLASTVLKIPHHGSISSSTMPFIKQVSPKIGVIQAGSGNPFSHPNRRILQRYADLGVIIYRTDRDGAVSMITDGTELVISTFNQSSRETR